MTRQQRKAARQKYYKTTAGKNYQIKRNTAVATILGGPLVGVTVGLITAKRNGQLGKTVNKGKARIEKMAATKIADLEIKKRTLEDTRVTGKEESDFWKSFARQIENDPEFRRAVSK